MFLIKKQKYLELLEQQQMKRALIVLRSEITPLQPDPSKLHELSRYILEDLYSLSM